MLVVSFWIYGGPVLASVSLAEAKVQKLVGMIKELADQHAASLARSQKLAGRLRSAQTAIMGRFGRADLRPLSDLIGRGGGIPSPDFKGLLRWWVLVLPAITPRLISSYQEPEDAEPLRIFSDAAGEGKLASSFFFSGSNLALPVLLRGSSRGELNALAATTNPTYNYELFATVASVFQLRERLTGRRSIFFVDNEAACAALTTGTSKVPGSLLSLYALWAIAAERDVGLLTERVPTGGNPAGSLPDMLD